MTVPIKTTAITCSNHVQEAAISSWRISPNGLMLVRYMGKDDGPRNHRFRWQLPALGNYGRDNILQRTIA